MSSRVGIALLAAGLMTGTAAADVVRLTNGESFEGVIAERQGDHVFIRLEFGELRLPAASVERIESSDSALTEYLKLRQALLVAEGTAKEWLELAQWARVRGLEHSYREALLEAAAIDPHLDGLAPGMRGLGFVLDEELDRWISYDEHMRRSGLVRHRGEWVSPEARAAESHSAEAERREMTQALSRTVELLALAQLERENRESRESRQTTQVGGAPYGYPVAYFGGGYFVPPKRHRDGHHRGHDPGTGTLPEELFRRQPGSLLPVGGANSGGRARQPGSLLPATSSSRR